MDPLRKRRDFLAAAKAQRAGVSAFLLQGRDRGDSGTIRVGFTATKKIGKAVVRNRIRRRLREVVRQVVPEAGKPGHDYVLVARELALTAPFAKLTRELERALRKLHDPARAVSASAKGPARGRRAAAAGSGTRPEHVAAAAMFRGAAPVTAPQVEAAPRASASDSLLPSSSRSDTQSDPHARPADGGHPA